MPSNSLFDKFSLLRECTGAGGPTKKETVWEGSHEGQPCPKKGCTCCCDGCWEISDKRKASRRGRNSRAKGKKAQNAVKDALTHGLGLSKDDLFGASGGSKESDIRGSAEFQKRFGFRPEVKNEKKIRMADYIEQAEVDNHQLKSEVPWVIIFKQHGSSQFYATVKLQEFIKLVGVKGG